MKLNFINDSFAETRNSFNPTSSSSVYSRWTEKQGERKKNYRFNFGLGKQLIEYPFANYSIFLILFRIILFKKTTRKFNLQIG